ncbi:carboxypeptidase [Acrocarpospora pleiomorpha]|uniref:Carboxypeptidase n=1 Tax=Acrocarpospora pleiomorpha TaxID=90975 RepID=A0A5M3XKZ5_9ACTN|nr:transglycosylase domain-containing protein [Acrocarpospora pleiomorpha]GES22087.1 carboxypeptidase [Acrocarpospora pleiomorpha]
MRSGEEDEAPGQEAAEPAVAQEAGEPTAVLEAVEPTAKPRRRLLRRVLIAGGIGIAGLIGMFGVVWAMTPIPDTTQALATAQGSLFYYRDGKTVLATQGVNRKNVPLSKVPAVVKDAVIAAENRTFYQDTGVSLTGTARAMWSTFTGQQIQGGSTITQQMVRNYYSGLSQERSVIRKLKEIMISLKVDRSKSKDWVLEQYLNTIYFGRGAHGVQAASLAYFNKDVSKLGAAEGAYLAAVIQQPTRFADPKGADLEAVKARWQAVVSGMTETKVLTSAQAAGLVFPTLVKQKAPLSLGGQKGYMLAQVRAELNRLGYSDEDINQGGLKVTTTFDRKLMGLAEEAVKTVLPDDTPKKVRTGLAAVDPATGEVVAFYGGRDYNATEWNNAFDAKVQAGSTFKAYALAAALENGFDLWTRVDGNSPMHIASATIPNSGDASYGSVDLVQATRSSVNTAFVDLGQKVGLAKVARAAEAAGIPADQLTQHQAAPTFPLGVASVSAVQQASAYGTFAADGIHHDAHVIRSITDVRGHTRQITAPGKRAFSAETTADTSFALQQVVQGGTGTAARLYDRPAAGKTGTTDESAAVWFTGYVPQLSVAVNMFRDDNKAVTVPGYGALYGGTLPAQIWKYFMSAAMDGKPVEEFPPPTDYQTMWSSPNTPSDQNNQNGDGENPDSWDSPSPFPTPTDTPETPDSPPPTEGDGQGNQDNPGTGTDTSNPDPPTPAEPEAPDPTTTEVNF